MSRRARQQYEGGAHTRLLPALTQQPDVQSQSSVHGVVQNEPNGGNIAHVPVQHGSKLGPQRSSGCRQTPSRTGRQIPSGRPHV